MGDFPTTTIGVLLFDQFELLDVFGPLEMFGMFPDRFRIQMLAEKTGVVASAQGPKVVTDATLSAAGSMDVLLIPGGAGTRVEVTNDRVLDWLVDVEPQTALVTSVCTGSAVLAATGLLNGREATTNKNAYDWVTSCGPDVIWKGNARWVTDGKFWTASGVSAGIDMSLALIAHLIDEQAAIQAADWAEYRWNADPDNDPFALA